MQQESMTHSSFLRRLFVDHRRSVTLGLLALLLGGYLWAPSEIHAQTAVTLAPLPIQQLFNANGVPLAFGCVFSYQVATSTPLSTYTDYTGTTLNANPVILSASGTYSMWLQAGVSYSLVVKSAGGTNCSSGSTIAFVNGVGGGSTTLTTIVPYSATPAFMVAAQNQLFEITLTGNASAQPLTFVGITPPSYVVFQITQDGSGGHTFSWPANSVGGCNINPAANSVTQQMFVYNGVNATAVGPCVSGGGSFFGAIFATSIVDSGPLTVDGFSLLNGFLGCVEGTAPDGVATEDIFWCDSTAHRWEMNNNDVGADTVVGAATSDTFTNKTYDTAGTGNVFKINGTPVSAVTGGGPTAVLNANPTLVGWNCAITSKTTTYTLLASDCIVHASASGGSFVISIPHAIVGNYWEITRTDSFATHSLTLEGDSGNVNGLASITLTTGGTYLCHADGTNSWCQTSPGATAPLMQATLLTGSATTFTYPIPYSTAPNCFCTGVNGSCNVSTGGVSTTACIVNTTVANTYVMVVGLP